MGGNSASISRIFRKKWNKWFSTPIDPSLDAVYTDIVENFPLADLRGDPRGARPSHSGSNFFHFHVVFGKKFGQIIGWRSHLGEILDPSLFPKGKLTFRADLSVHVLKNSRELKVQRSRVERHEPRISDCNIKLNLTSMIVIIVLGDRGFLFRFRLIIKILPL